MEQSECPVCKGSSLSERKVGRTSMLRCTECGVTITPHKLRRVNEPGFYEHSYVSIPSSRASAQQYRYSRYPEYIRLVAEIGRHCPPPARWLDVGCGSGAFLEECRNAGYSVEGIELSRTETVEAERAGIRVHHDLKGVYGPLDVISMWHVLEHLDEPREMLQSLRSLMRPEGILCIRVPNFAGRWSGLLRDKWVWFQAPIHITHFGPDSLRKLLNDTGFEIEMIRKQRPNDWLVRRAYSLAADVFNTYTNAPRESVKGWVFRLLKDISAEEVFVIARRRA